MSTDTLLTLLNVVFVVLLSGIGVEMVNNPPGEEGWKKWLYRALFAGFGLTIVIVTVVQSARNNAEQDSLRDEAQKRERELSNKVSEQGGKLDAIAHFEQQFLAFVSQQRVGAPDAQAKAYEAMAMAVMNMAQGPGRPPSWSDTRLAVLCEGRELNGQTITVKPVPSGALPVRIQINVRNEGSHVSGAVSARLYFSKEISGAGDWEPFGSDDPAFPSAFYIGGSMSPAAAGINPQETFVWDFNGQIPQPFDAPISARLKVFYGSSKPVEANFTIRKRE